MKSPLGIFLSPARLFCKKCGGLSISKARCGLHRCKKEARRLIAAARCGFGTMMGCCTINKTSWVVIVETGASQIELIVANLQVAEIS